jgi:aldehyde dehydrogenase (NAD+)
VLEHVAGAISAAADDLAELITWESGLCLADTRHEVARAIDVFRLAANETLRDDGILFSGDVSPGGRRRRAFTTREPVRVVAAITPFNHPLNQVAHKLAPAIGAAAPIVLKPSEKTPLAALWLARAVLEAGYPEDAVAVVTGDREAVLAEMLRHEAVEVVMCTGGLHVGDLIARGAGLRRTVLELGGNDPLLASPTPISTRPPPSASPAPRATADNVAPQSSGSSPTRRSRTISSTGSTTAPVGFASATRSTQPPTWAR